MSTETTPELILGSKIADSGGDNVGTVEGKYQDPAVDSTDWVAIGTGLLGRKYRMAPLRGAEEVDGQVRLAFTKDQITSAPECPDDGRLTEEVERELYTHYGLDWSEYVPERDYGDRRKDFGSDEAPVTYDEDSEIRDPARGTRRDVKDMVLPEHADGVRPHPADDAVVETTGPIAPPARAGGDDDPTRTPDS